MASRRSLSLAVLLLALVAVVALASRAHAPTGGSGTHRINGELVLQYVTLALVTLAAIGVPVFAYALWRSRGKKEADLPVRGNWMKRVFATIVLLVVIASAYTIYRSTHRPNNQTPVRPGSARPAQAGGQAPAARQLAHERFDWVPAIAIFLAVAGGVTAATVLLLRRRAHAGESEADLALQLSLVLDDSLDDLRAEGDPRRAVIAAYARMERVLGLAGLPRRAAEAPLEYLARVLRDLLSASAASVARLTALFERAKFSHHGVDSTMKEEAIAALVAVRDELRSAAR